MPGMHHIAVRLTAVEEKLHFLHQTITACRGAPLNREALAGLAHIVSDLVSSVQEVRRDVDSIKGREELHPPLVVCDASRELDETPSPELSDLEDDTLDDAQEHRRHGAS